MRIKSFGFPWAIPDIRTGISHKYSSCGHISGNEQLGLVLPKALVLSLARATQLCFSTGFKSLHLTNFVSSQGEKRPNSITFLKRTGKQRSEIKYGLQTGTALHKQVFPRTGFGTWAQKGTNPSFTAWTTNHHKCHYLLARVMRAAQLWAP